MRGLMAFVVVVTVGTLVVRASQDEVRKLPPPPKCEPFCPPRGIRGEAAREFGKRCQKSWIDEEANPYTTEYLREEWLRGYVEAEEAEAEKGPGIFN